MGDHKDDEKELDPNVPIASLTLGAERDFIFKHQDRKKNNLENVKILLKDGMLLLMKNPTNTFWYHGLPPRKSCHQPRINLTFRKILNWFRTNHKLISRNRKLIWVQTDKDFTFAKSTQLISFF